MKEEKHEKESKVKKKLTRIIGTIIVGGVLMMTAGCGITGKGSRSWLENEVSDIEKVYPTENPEDLFEKFPNGFIITQTRLFIESGKRYSIDLEINGEKDIRKIEGKVKKVLLESEPSYKETIEKESKVEYLKGKGLVLEKSELTDELLPKNYFLFQKLKLNKDILKKLEVKDKSFSFETYRYNIKYVFTSKEIDDYLGLDKGKVSLDIRGRYSERDKTYFHSVVITEDRKELYFAEKIEER
ncbi:hypothetical protein [Gemella morbillorum]|uniref:hypothetical protein n=1 Tax=Gemella morbillorum TaxID=29391 RepID=UPI001CAE8CB5|nr:hypothetical protein [Gemella morbillorum]MBF1213181.1 hypothetical protein [Gemella morbillorum]